LGIGEGKGENRCKKKKTLEKKATGPEERLWEAAGGRKKALTNRGERAAKQSVGD